MIRIAGFHEPGVRRLAFRCQPVPAQQAMTLLRQSEKFARVRFRAFEDTLLNQALANEVLHIAANGLRIVAVSMFCEVLRGDDTELPEVNDCANFGSREPVTPIAVVQNSAAISERDLPGPIATWALWCWRAHADDQVGGIAHFVVGVTVHGAGVRSVLAPLELVELSR